MTLFGPAQAASPMQFQAAKNSPESRDCLVTFHLEGCMVRTASVCPMAQSPMWSVFAAQ